MRRVVLLSLAALAVGCTTTPSQASGRNVYEFQPCTTGSCSRSASPATASEGMALGSVKGFRVTVCTPPAFTISDGGTMPAATLSGGGTVQLWTYDPDMDGLGDGGWGRNSTLDWTPDNGARCSNRDFESLAQMNSWRVAAGCSGCTESIADAGVGGLWVNIDACLNGSGC